MRFGGIVLATVLTVGACSGDPEPKEPGAPPPTTSAAPARTIPTPIAQVSEDSPEGAAAFVKHYVDVFNYAAATGDVAELTRLSSPTCEGCQSYIDLYRDTYEAGGYFKGGDWTIGELQISPSEEDMVIFAPITSDAGSFRSDSEASPEPGNPEDSDLTFVANRAGSSWRITTLELQAS